MIIDKYLILVLLLTGKPLKEPAAWEDPIAMNTKEQLQTAFVNIRKELL